MRSHFREKDSASIFSELSNAVQAANESCLDFIMRVMCLREKVISLSEEEGCPYGRVPVSQRFSHTILTGLRSNNIRNELRSFLKQKVFSDEELLKVVTEAVANETEYFSKTEKKSAKIQSVVVEKPLVEKTKKEKDTPLPQQIQKIKLLQEREMSSVRTELQEIKSLLHGTVSRLEHRDARPSFHNKPRKTFRRKCQTCYQNGVPSCFHCFQCGSSEHRVVNCPVNSGN